MKTTNKDIIFEQDYSIKEPTNFDVLSETIFNFTSDEILPAIGQRMREAPHIISPKGKETYDKMLELLNQYAMDRHCKIQGHVSFYDYEATIKLIFCFFEFYGEIDLSMLKYIVENASVVSFYPVKDTNEITMSIHIPYFECLEDIDEIISDEFEKRL